MNLKKLLKAFELTYKTEKAKALLTPRWKAENDELGAPPSTGFCYIAAEAAFHILKKYKPKAVCASYVEGGLPATHWWILINGGSIFDPTATQYTKLKPSEDPPYHLGKGKAFLTQKPSKRASALMRMVRQNYRDI